MAEFLFNIIFTLFFGVLIIYVNNKPPYVILKKKTKPDISILKINKNNNLLCSTKKYFGYKLIN